MGSKREICQSGSEGRGIEPNRSSLPLSKTHSPNPRVAPKNALDAIVSFLFEKSVGAAPHQPVLGIFSCRRAAWGPGHSPEAVAGLIKCGLKQLLQESE
jgi:hypothetical protein